MTWFSRPRGLSPYGNRASHLSRMAPELILQESRRSPDLTQARIVGPMPLLIDQSEEVFERSRTALEEAG